MLLGNHTEDMRGSYNYSTPGRFMLPKRVQAATKIGYKDRIRLIFR